MIEVLGAWWNSRRWGSLSIAVAMFCFLLLPTMIATYVRTQRQEVLARSLIIQTEKILPGHQLVQIAMDKIYIEATSNIDPSKAPLDGPLIDSISDRSALGRAPTIESVSQNLNSLRIAYQHLLRINPSDPTTKFRLAMVHELHGEREEAMAMIARLAPEESARYLPAHACQSLYIQANNRRDAASLLQLQHHVQASLDWIDLDPKIISQASSYYFDCGQMSIALELAKSASQKSPRFAYRSAKLLSQLGRQTESAREVQRAISWFESLDSTSLEWPCFFEVQAWCYRQNGDSTRVREVLRKGIKIANPSDSRLKELLADELLHDLEVSMEDRSQNWDRLATILAESADLFPANTRLGEFVSEALLAGLKVPESAQAALKSQLQNGAASAKTHRTLAQTLAKRNRTKEALVQIKKSLDLDPKSADAWTSCAMLQLRLDPNDLDEAVQCVQKALANGGNSADLHEVAGEIAMREGDWSSAVASWEKSLTIDPMRLDLRNRVILAYATIGNYDAVDRHRQTKAQLSPQEVPEGPVALREKATPQTQQP